MRHRLAILAFIVFWALAFWLIAMPSNAQTEPKEVDMILNCGTLRGNGSAVIRIYGKTFAVIAIHCERV